MLQDPATWLTAAAVVVAIAALLFVFVGLRGTPRGRSLCRRCDYDMAALPGAPTCPECGNAPGLATPPRRRQRWGPIVAGLALAVIPLVLGRWVTPIADWIWDSLLPQRAEIHEFDSSGLRWKLFRERGFRTVPRRNWPDMKGLAVRHPILGWIDVTPEAVHRLVYVGESPEAKLVGWDLAPRDLTGDGLPEALAAGYSGGAYCCNALFVVDLKSSTRPVITIPGEYSLIHPVDVDGDGVWELRVRDWSLADGTAAFTSSPAPTVILSLRGGEIRADAVAMRRPPPTEAELRALAESSPRPWSDRGPLLVFWEPVVDLLYSDNEREAWMLLDLIWPDGLPGKREFRQDLLGALQKHGWWRLVRQAQLRTPRP